MDEKTAKILIHSFVTQARRANKESRSLRRLGYKKSKAEHWIQGMADGQEIAFMIAARSIRDEISK